ncbi:hypothetical protein ACFORG_23590 [Lutimaribacter marinistellae]|uniref:Uncharacterized protein n=1 Tax=Lutimaribacter marinistellae TaxID=1820329 RepID=A0ABV7TM89_9RHOB
MSEIEELQRRITAAMERIGAGVTSLSERPVAVEVAEPTTEEGEDGPGAAALAEALDEEKMANAQLEERLKTLKARHAEEIEELKGQSDGETVEALQVERDALKAQLEDTAELDALKAELADLSEKLLEAETARARLSEEIETLQQNDQTTMLTAEIDALKAQIEATEDPAPLRSEIERLTALAAEAEQVESLRAENAALKGELAESERLSELSAELDMLRAERVSHGEAMGRLDGDLQRLRKSNEQMTKALAEMRETAQDQLGDPALLNSAMLAELEALRAARATDAAEAHAVLSRLGPLLAQANLTEGEDE